MSLKTSIQSALVVTLVCSPAWIHSSKALTRATKLSSVAKTACYMRQPDMSVGVVSYYKGNVTLNGKTLDRGALLRKGDTVTTTYDGFVSVELTSGQTVSIQPATSLSIDCSLDTVDSDISVHHIIDKPHLLGAIRG